MHGSSVLRSPAWLNGGDGYWRRVLLVDLFKFYQKIRKVLSMTLINSDFGLNLNNMVSSLANDLRSLIQGGSLMGLEHSGLYFIQYRGPLSLPMNRLEVPSSRNE